MSSRAASKQARKREAVGAPALIKSKEQREFQARTQARTLLKEAGEQAAAAAEVRAALMALAGIDDPTLQELKNIEAVERTRAVLSELRTLAPMLEQDPDLLHEAQDVIGQAQLRLRTPGYVSMAETGSTFLQKTSPTGSTPVASGNTAGVAWAGIGNKRTDAQGVPNAQFLRNLATKNPWVQSAITYRKQQIGRADITVVPMDETKHFDASIQNALERLLDYPNEYRDSYRSFIEPVIDDVLTLDRGCISKDLDSRGIPHNLYYEDGATIKIFADWTGDPKKPRYVFQPPNSMTQIPLMNEQLICIMSNAASYRYGLSPVQVLLDTIRGDIAATEKASALVRDVPPPTIVGIQGAGEETIRRLANKYDRDVAGKKEIMFVGTTQDQEIQVYPLSMNLRDMQFMEWQEYLARKICAVFQISPQNIGLTFDINKATAGVQADITEDSGIIGLMLLIEEYLNRELLADWAPVDKDGRPKMDALNLRVFYPEVSEMQRMRHAERVIKSANDAIGALPLMTPNEARAMLGEEPFPHGGNTIWIVNQNGAIPTVLSYDDDLGDYGELLTAGDLGAQPPEGGIDEGAKGFQKPQKDEAGALGNESSANGQPPDNGVGDTTGGGSAPPAGTAGANGGGNGGGAGSSATKAMAWLPPPSITTGRDRRLPGKSWHPGLDRQQRHLHPVVVTPSTTKGKRQAVPGKVTGKPMAATPLGHIKEHAALAHPQPPGVGQSRKQLQRQVKAVFDHVIAEANAS